MTAAIHRWRQHRVVAGRTSDGKGVAFFTRMRGALNVRRSRLACNQFAIWRPETIPAEFPERSLVEPHTK